MKRNNPIKIFKDIQKGSNHSDVFVEKVFLEKHP